MTPGQWSVVFMAGRAAIPDNGGSPAQVLRAALDAMADAALEISLDTEVHPAYPTTSEQTFTHPGDDYPLTGQPDDPYPDITREVTRDPSRYFSPDDPRSRPGVWARERKRQAEARERLHTYRPQHVTFTRANEDPQYGPCAECGSPAYKTWHTVSDWNS